MFKRTSLSNKDILFLIAILVIVFLLYINTLDNPFIWDDEVIIESNKFIQEDFELGQIFTKGIWGAKLQANSFYRPINALTFAFDYMIWESNPFGFHLTSIFLFLVFLVILFFLLLRLGFNKLLVFGLVLGFGVHPINTEAVSYISGRADILMLIFSGLSFFFFIKGLNKKKIKYYIFSLFLLLFALLSKENAIVVPFLIGFYCLLFHKKKYKEFFKWLCLQITISFLYFIFRLFLLSQSNTISLSTIAKATLFQRLITLPRVFFTYIVKTTLPFQLHMEYLFVVENILSLDFILGLIFVIGFFFVILKFLDFSKKALFLTGWFFIGLLPFLNIYPTLTATLREHWVCFSMIGLLGLLLLVVKKIFQDFNFKKASFIGLIVFFIIIFLYWSGYTVLRNNQWQNPKEFYKHDLKYEPNSFLLHNNLGVEYFREGNFLKAQKHFLKSIQKAPGIGYAPAFNNLGVIYENQKQPKKAIQAYKKSIHLDNYLLAYQNLLDLYTKNNNRKEFQLLFKKAINHYPNNPVILKYKKR